MTGAGLGEAALVELGILQEGEPMSPSQANIVIPRLAMMIDTFSSWQDMIWYERQELYTLVSGKAEYSIGPDNADFPLDARPVKIVGAVLRINPGDGFPVDYKILEESPSDYNDIGVKTIQAPPRRYGYNPTLPNAIMTFWPVPDQIYQVRLSMHMPFATITKATASCEVSLPPGMLECMMYNLAVRLGPAFGTEAAITTKTKADYLLKKIKQQNFSTLMRRVPVDQSAPGTKRNAGLYAWTRPNQ